MVQRDSTLQRMLWKITTTEGIGLSPNGKLLVHIANHPYASLLASVLESYSLCSLHLLLTKSCSWHMCGIMSV